MRRIHALVVVLLAVLAASVPTASAAPVRGPDVSNNNVGYGRSCQSAVNWHKVRQSGYRFGFAKAVEGTGFRDRCFGYNWQAMLHEGIVRGAYDFAHPSSGSGTNEARSFVNYVNAYGGFYHAFAVLDIEAHSAGQSANRRFVQSWVNYVRIHATGLGGVVIYSGNWWWAPNIGCWFPAGVMAWPANYSPRPILLECSGGWDWWQYTDGRYGLSPKYVPGIGNGDVSVFSGDFNRLLALSGQLQLHAYASRTLRVGRIGSDVRGFQDALNKRMAARHHKRIHVDGLYGPTTETAKHYTEYVLGFPLGTVKRFGVSRWEQNLVAHPDQRPKSYLPVAKYRAAQR